MDIFSSLTAYHWLVLGLIFLGAEALGAAGFLLGAGVAALATGAVVWFAPELAAGLHLVIFAIGAILATYLYFEVFRVAKDDADDAEVLNQRAAALIGHTFTLDNPIENGAGRVQIGDTFWRVKCDANLQPGSTVVVVGANDMSLELAAAE